MPEKPFRVNVYEVDLLDDSGLDPLTFANAIESACKESIPGRFKSLGDKGRRLEHYDQRDGCFLLNFVTLAFDGPGRSAPGSMTEPIDLALDEHFSHETAMLYDPGENLVFLESGQGGMTNGAIARYFREFAENGEMYSLVPRLDAEASSKARRYQTIRSLVMRMTVGPVTNIDREAGTGVIKGFGEQYDAESIKVEIKVSRSKNRTLSISNIWKSINPILASDDRNNIDELKLNGYEHEDEGMKVIDLLKHQEKRALVLNIDPDSRNVPHEARWQALLNIRKEFMV